MERDQTIVVLRHGCTNAQLFMHYSLRNNAEDGDVAPIGELALKVMGAYLAHHTAQSGGFDTCTRSNYPRTEQSTKIIGDALGNLPAAKIDESLIPNGRNECNALAEAYRSLLKGLEARGSRHFIMAHDFAPGLMQHCIGSQGKIDERDIWDSSHGGGFILHLQGGVLKSAELLSPELLMKEAMIAGADALPPQHAENLKALAGVISQHSFRNLFQPSDSDPNLREPRYREAYSAWIEQLRKAPAQQEGWMHTQQFREAAAALAEAHLAVVDQHLAQKASTYKGGGSGGSRNGAQYR